MHVIYACYFLITIAEVIILYYFPYDILFNESLINSFRQNHEFYVGKLNYENGSFIFEFFLKFNNVHILCLILKSV